MCNCCEVKTAHVQKLVVFFQRFELQLSHSWDWVIWARFLLHLCHTSIHNTVAFWLLCTKFLSFSKFSHGEFKELYKQADNFFFRTRFLSHTRSHFILSALHTKQSTAHHHQQCDEQPSNNEMLFAASRDFLCSVVIRLYNQAE